MSIQQTVRMYGAATVLLGGMAICFAADDGITAPTNNPPPAFQPTTQPDQPSPSAQAGERQQAGALFERLRARLGELNLSDDQKQKIEGFFTDARTKLEAMREQLKNATREERLEQVRPIFQKLRTDIESVLSPEQVQALKQKLEAGGRTAGQTGGQVLGKLRNALSQLQLSDDQKQKAEDLLKETRAKIEQIRTEAGDDVGPKLRAAGEDLRTKLGNLLTPEQKTKLRELMQSTTQPATHPAP